MKMFDPLSMMESAIDKTEGLNKVRTNWQMWSGIIPSELLDDFIKEVEENWPVQEATTFNDASDYRSSKIRWINGNAFAQDLLTNFATMAAKEMDIHIHNDCEIQYTEYHATENGKYDWHHDIDWNRADGYDRKVSIILQLSDPSEYDGGEFSFSEVENPVPEQLRQKGTILCFPSYLVHQVSPVTRGTRRSVVAWFQGPKWR